MNHAKPTVRDDDLRLSGGKPTFTVMMCKEIHRGFDDGKPNIHRNKTKIVEMVLMDGSHTLFVARLNSGIIHKLLGGFIEVGSLITIKDHDFIWMWAGNMFESRAMMFVKYFDWEPNVCDSSAHMDPRVQGPKVGMAKASGRTCLTRLLLRRRSSPGRLFP